MKVRKYSAEYQTREFSLTREEKNVQISWRFKEGSHFLIFVYDSRYTFALKPALEKATKAAGSDENIIFSDSRRPFFEESGGFKAFCCSEKEFLSSKKCYFLPAGELKRGVPYTISVYVCAYDEGKKLLQVIEPEGEQNVLHVPVMVHPEITYKTKAFSKQKECLLKLPSLESYKEGAIMYHVDPLNIDFPLPEKCLGKILSVMVPKDAEVSIRIRNEYREFYKNV